jgi:hypothetical protein
VVEVDSLDLHLTSLEQSNLDLVLKSNDISKTVKLINSKNIKYKNLIILSNNYNLEKLLDCTVLDISVFDYYTEYASRFTNSLYLDDRVNLNDFNLKNFISKFIINEYDLLVPLTYGDTVSLVYSQIIGEVKSQLPEEWNPKFLNNKINNLALWEEFKNQKIKPISDFKIEPCIRNYPLFISNGYENFCYMTPKFKL